MNYLSLILPIAYLGILVGSLATFSHLYRQRKLNAKLGLSPYFSPHTARNIYLSLMHLQDSEPNTKVPESVLRTALLNRAIEDIMRIMEIRTRKGPLNTLLQRGVVGDEIWQRLLRAEQELEHELKDVVAEANALAPGWGNTIFQSASEMAQNRILKEKLDKVRATVPKEKAAWNAQREKSRMELEGTSVTLTEQVELAAPNVTEVKKEKPVSSDEDAVLVETPGMEVIGVTESPTGRGGKNKKKKAKK